MTEKEKLKDYLNIDLDNLIVVNSLTYKVKSFRPNGTYAHGKLEDKLEYDIFDFKQIDQSFKTVSFHDLPDNDILQGIYDCKTEDDLKCKFFVWNYKINDSKILKRGLVVLESDIKSMEYAQKCYDEKRTYL